MHRDLKPENILVILDQYKNPGVLKICDFGYCTTQDYEEESIGTPFWKPPDMLFLDLGKGEKYDKMCDIFALGQLYYYLLKGENPFKYKCEGG